MDLSPSSFAPFSRLLLHLLFLVLLLFCTASHAGVLPHPSRHRLRKAPPLSSTTSLSSNRLGGGPDVFFEVSQPVGGSSPCSVLVLQHSFADTYSLPPAVANYTPPSDCGNDWNRIVLKWSGTCKGRQFDRISAVWFGGIEVLRTCTAEPTSRGIYWEVRKDVSRFSSVFKSPQTVMVELANVVDSTYTGIFNINITLEFYRSDEAEGIAPEQAFASHGNMLKSYSRIDNDRDRNYVHESSIADSNISNHKRRDDDDININDGSNRNDVMRLQKPLASHDLRENQGNELHDVIKMPDDISALHMRKSLAFGGINANQQSKQTDDANVDGGSNDAGDSLPRDLLFDDGENATLPFPSERPADIVLPMSNSQQLSQGHWFQLSSENDTASVVFDLPTNIIRAVLEVCVSFHGNDEFWYTNPPNDYLEANGLSDYPGNGPFREVEVFLDGTMVGAVWPFPVIFTGGINPLYWRPAAAIGAYNLPSYDIELTPFIGSLADGNNHTISMRVKSADGSWPLDANLHLWLDSQTSQTLGGLLRYDAPPLNFHETSVFEGLDGEFHTSAQRLISFSGNIISVAGNIFVSASYSFSFKNVQIFQNDSDVQIVTQGIQMKGKIIAKKASKVIFSQVTDNTFPLYLYCSLESGANSVYTQGCNLTHSFNQEKSIVSSSTSAFESLRNWQAAQGSMTVVGSSVTAGVGALQQHYDYESTSGCYERILNTKNYSILFDAMDLSCGASKFQ